MIMPEEDRVSLLALFSAWSNSGSLLSLQQVRDSFSQQELDAFEASLQLRPRKS
jgi:hypothetical protein